MELTIEQTMQQAVSAHNQGKLQDAEQFYSTILKNQPIHPEANHNLGLIAVSTNKTEAALAFFKIALDAKPQIGQFWLSYIDALIKNNQIETAKVVLEQGKNTGLFGNRFDNVEKQLNTNSVGPSESQLNQLLEQYTKGQYKEAEKSALLLTQQFPQHQFSWKLLGVIFGENGKLEEAINANQKAIQLVPHDAETHNNLGNALKDLGRLAEAEASFRQAITLKSDVFEPYYNLGLILKELERLDEAEVSLRQATTLKNDDAEAHSSLGITLQAQGRLEEAEAAFRQAIILKEDYAEAHNNLGVTLQELGKLNEAEVSLRKALTLKPGSSETHNNLGGVLKDLKKLEEAESNFLQAIAIKPKYIEAHNNLGITLSEIGRLEEAEVRLKHAIALQSNNPDSYNNLGATLLLMGKLEYAEVNLRKALALKPDLASAIQNLATVLNYMNNIDAAIDSYKQLLHVDPDNLGLIASVNLAILDFLVGDFVKSKEYLLAASKIHKKTSSRYKNQQIFHSYLLTLLKWHAANHFDSAKLINHKNIYVIGESHSLVSHQLPVQNSGHHFLGKALLIVGCKQWHLGNSTINQYKIKFERIIHSLPKASDILLAIGEIDCRIDGGIIKHKNKYPEKDIKELIASTVENYLNYVFELNESRENNIIIQGVPCPNIDTATQSTKAVTELIDVLKIFNDELRKRSKEKGFEFLDLHKLTDRGDGFSNTIWHIDSHHISHAGMQQAWRHLSRKNVAKQLNTHVLGPSESQLNQLLKQYNRGRYYEAEKFALLLTQQFPEHPYSWKVLGVIRGNDGRYLEAIEANQKAIQLVPHDAETHNNLGNALKDLGRLEEAEAILRQALALKFDYAEAYNNLGATFHEQSKLDEAEASLRQAIMLKANFAEAHNNLGITIKELGRLDEAEISLRHAIAMKPDLVSAILNLSTVLNYLNNVDAAIDLYKRVLTIDSNNLGLSAGVSLAIFKFLEGDFTQCKEYLLGASKIREKTSAQFKNQQVYHSYLLKLLEWHAANDFDSAHIISNKNLYVIGESHSLVSHQLPIQHSGSHFMGKALLIEGCKQWHLGNSNCNQYKTKFERIIHSLPKASDILLAIGEIDCRIDGGIIKHKNKYPEKDIHELIAITVENYLNYVFKLNASHGHNIIIQGVPCPNINIATLSTKAVTELIEVLKMFNVVLKNKSKEQGFGFLDLHKLTDRGDGFSNAMWHLDSHHISHEGMQKAWRVHFSNSI